MEDKINDIVSAIASAYDTEHDDADLIGIFAAIEKGFALAGFNEREFARAVFSIYGTCGSLQAAASAMMAAQAMVEKSRLIENSIAPLSRIPDKTKELVS